MKPQPRTISRRTVEPVYRLLTAVSSLDRLNDDVWKAMTAFRLFTYRLENRAIYSCRG
jgi:hypothetical protein